MAKGRLGFPQISVLVHIHAYMSLGRFRPTQESAVFAPTRGMHFWTLHNYSYLLIQTLLWCEHGTIAKGRPGFPQLSVLGPVLTFMKRGSLPSRTGKGGFCSN